MKTRYIIAYFFLTAILSTSTYHIFHQKWVEFRKGETALSNKQYEKAQLFFLDSLKKGMNPYRIAEHIEQLNVPETGYNLAKNILESQLQKGGKNYDRYLLFALYYLDNNKLPQAIALFQTAIESFPEKKDAHIFLARAYIREGNKEKALQEYQKALGIQ